MTAIAGPAPAWARLRLFERAAPQIWKPGKIGRTAGDAQSSGSIAQGHDPQGTGGVRSASRGSLVASRQRGEWASVARKTGSYATRWADFSRRHPHHRRSATARAALAPRDRRRKASPAKLALIDDGVLRSWIARLRDRAQQGLATTGHASRGVSSTPSPGVAITCEARLADADRDIKDGFVADLIGMGVNMVTGDYWPRRLRFLDRDGSAHAVSESHRGPLAGYFTAASARQRSRIRYGINAPTVRLEGLTVAGQ